MSCTRDDQGEGLVLFVVVLLDFSYASIECLKCSSASNLDLCTEVSTCDNVTEECYLEQVTTSSLQLVYNAGCRAKQVCKLLASLGVGRKRAVSCSECCDKKDRCNAELCKTSQQKVDHCAVCKDIENTADCSRFLQCQKDQACSMKQYFKQGRILYELDCEFNNICLANVDNKYTFGEVTTASAGKRQGGFLFDMTLCEACCKGEHCNVNTTCPQMAQAMKKQDYITP